MNSYRLKDGLFGVPSHAHTNVIDGVLRAEASSYERRLVLIDHERLAARADWYVRIVDAQIAEDDAGRVYIPLPGGRRAYDAEELLDCLDREHLGALTALVRDALFRRFVEDVAEWR